MFQLHTITGNIGDINANNNDQEFVVPHGKYDLRQSSVQFKITFDDPANTEDVYYRKNFPITFQNPCTITKDNAPIHQIADLTALQAQYHYSMKEKKLGNQIIQAIAVDPFINLKVEAVFIKTGAGGAANNIYINYPFLSFFPYLTENGFFDVMDNATFQFKGSGLTGILLDLTIAAATLLELAATNIQITFNMCKIQDLSIAPDQGIQPCILQQRMPIAAARTQQFNFKTEEQKLCLRQGVTFIPFTNLANSWLYGLVDNADIGAPGDNSIGLVKNGNYQIKLYQNNTNQTIANDSYVHNLISQMKIYNATDGSCIPCTLQDQYFSRSAINIKSDYSATGDGFIMCVTFYYVTLDQ